jgi:hypothetical protein
LLYWESKEGKKSVLVKEKSCSGGSAGSSLLHVGERGRKGKKAKL